LKKRKPDVMTTQNKRRPMKLFLNEKGGGADLAQKKKPGPGKGRTDDNRTTPKNKKAGSRRARRRPCRSGNAGKKANRPPQQKRKGAAPDDETRSGVSDGGKERRTLFGVRTKKGPTSGEEDQARSFIN